MAKLLLVNFRGNDHLISLINVNEIFILAEDQFTFDDILMPRKEVKIKALIEKNVWSRPDSSIETIQTDMIEGVFSRKELKKLVGRQVLNLNDFAWISISDIDKDFLDLKSNNCLKLKFSDITEEQKNHKLFTIDQAIEIADFIEKNLDKKFIINCEAGISRSAAVAKFIEIRLEGKTDMNSEIEKHIRFEPNSFVLDTLLNL